jgi:hypothetical protein
MTQPEALRLADAYEMIVSEATEQEKNSYLVKAISSTAAELRRLHKVNEELVFALKYIEAQTHLGHIHDTASSALAIARGTE